MLQNYLKTAFRTLAKNRLNTFIQVAGLAMGMAACLLLLDYVGFELSYDHFHERGDRIYRVINDRYQDGKRVQIGAITYPTIGPVMAREFPEVEAVTRLVPSGEVLLQNGEQIERVENCLFVDKQFLNIFSFAILAARDDSLLARANEVALSRQLADRFFPGSEGDYQQILGKSLRLDRLGEPLTVVAVLDDVPSGSTLQFDLLASYATFVRTAGEAADNSWSWSDFYHYLLLRPGADVAALEAKFDDFSARHFRGQEVSGAEERFFLQPLMKTHLYSGGLEYEISKVSNGQSVWSLLLIAFFILVIAWMNYINLTSSRVIERAREVGIRKITGARKGQIAGQFVMEALLVNVASLLLAFQLAQLARPWLGVALGLEVDRVGFFQSILLQPELLATGLLLLLAGVLVSGIYPAWLLSGQHLSEVLKGVFGSTRRSEGLRRSLVVFQFAASVALIAGTLLVYRQLRFASEQDLGLDVDQVLMVSPPALSTWDSTFIDRMNTMNETLRRYPDIISASTSNRVPGQAMGRIFGLEAVDGGGENTFMANFILADYNYAETYGLTPRAGRFFTRDDHNSDPAAIESVIVNERAVSMLGFPSPEAAVGSRLKFWDREWLIAGVLPDFHQRTLHHSIEPVVFLPLYGTNNPLSIRIAGDDVNGTIARIKEVYAQFFPGNAFEYRFIDENFQTLYEGDRRFGQVLLFFTLLAIFIAIMGLFGLAAYAATLRTREVGIRKVLGASVGNLVALLSGDFLRLVAIAILIGLPLAWYGTSLWLREFAYRAPLAWWVFAVTGALALGLAFVTVGYQALRAATGNPVESLRRE